MKRVKKNQKGYKKDKYRTKYQIQKMELQINLSYRI